MAIGDGIVSALQILHVLRANKQTLEEATRDLHMYPQVLINVKVDKGVDCLGHNKVKAAVVDAERTLNGKGRVLLRVMVEGEDQKLVEQSAQRIAEVVRKLASSQT